MFCPVIEPLYLQSSPPRMLSALTSLSSRPSPSSGLPQHRGAYLQTCSRTYQVTGNGKAGCV